MNRTGTMVLQALWHFGQLAGDEQAIARLRRALPADQREGRLRMRPTRPTGGRPSSAESRRSARIEWAADDVARLAQSTANPPRATGMMAVVPVLLLSDNCH